MERRNKFCTSRLYGIHSEATSFNVRRYLNRLPAYYLPLTNFSPLSLSAQSLTNKGTISFFLLQFSTYDMGELENSVHCLQPPTTKKRVVLGDITNSQHVGSNRKSDFGPKKPKWTLDCKRKNEEEDQKPSGAEVAVSSMDHPLKCTYSNRIYRHLRDQEVFGTCHEFWLLVYIFHFFIFFALYLVRAHRDLCLQGLGFGIYICSILDSNFSGWLGVLGFRCTFCFGIGILFHI